MASTNLTWSTATMDSMSIMPEECSMVFMTNFYTGEYRTIRNIYAQETEQAAQEKRFSGFVRKLAEIGFLHPEDAKNYTRLVMRDFEEGKLENKRVVMLTALRCRPAESYIWQNVRVTMPNGVTEENPWGFFCLKDATKPFRGGSENEDMSRYCKILKVNMEDDSVQIIKASSSEVEGLDWQDATLTDWFRIFEENGGVHEADREAYRAFTDGNELRRRLFEHGETLRLCYRRAGAQGYERAEMELVPSRSKDSQSAMLYVRTLGEAPVAESERECISRRSLTHDDGSGLWNGEHLREIIGQYDGGGRGPLGIVLICSRRTDDAVRMFSPVWIIKDHFGADKCFVLGEGVYAAVFTGCPRAKVESCARTLRSRVSAIENPVITVSYAWEESPASAADVLVKAGSNFDFK